MNISEVSRYFPRARFGEIGELRPINDGLSGARVFAATTESGEYVLRIGPARESERWARQLVVQQLAAANQIAPRIELIDEDGHAVVSAKLGRASFAAVLGDRGSRQLAVGSLIQVLARLHALPTEGIGVVDPLAVARGAWNAQSGRAGFPAWAASIGARFERFERVLERDRRRVVSHNDVNPGNVLWDADERRVWLIDWEASGLTHPYYDIASLATFLSMPDEAALGLLAMQEGASISEQQAEVFSVLRQLATIMCGATFLGFVPDLTALVEDDVNGLVTPRECFGMAAAGALDLRSVRGQAMVGAALLRVATQA